MSEKENKFAGTNASRRRFCLALGAAAGAVAVVSLLPRRVDAADLPHVQESDSLAMSMGYKEDSGKVDNKAHATHKPDQQCANCQFYQGDKGAAYGPCQIFTGKSVNAKGWCQVWAQKQ